MTDKFMDKAWKKMELNCNYPLYIPKVINFHDPYTAEIITKTGKELLVEMLSRYPELETKDCEGISQKSCIDVAENKMILEISID